MKKMLKDFSDDDCMYVKFTWWYSTAISETQVISSVL